MKKIIFAIALLFTVSTVFFGCRDKKTADEKVEEALEEVGDEIENASDDVQDAVEDVKDEVEEVKEETQQEITNED